MKMLAVLACGCLLAGCTVGPKYQRPALTTPSAYRGASADQSSTGVPESLGDEKWPQVFQDPVLQQLIRTALQQNYDIQIAAARVLEAQAQLGITRANQFPMAAAGVEGYSQRNPKIANSFPAYEANDAELDLSVIWNLDFWGKYRRETEAARARGLRSGVRLAQAQQQQLLLAYEQTVMVAFQQVSDALVAYQKDREFREQQQLLTAAAQDTNRLSNMLYQNGGASYLQVLTAETNYFTAELNLAQAELNEHLSLVQLYNALGGGWQP